MIPVGGKTIGVAFDAAASRYGGNVFLQPPSAAGRGWYPGGAAFTYAEAAEAVAAYQAALTRAGYGHGHRAALHLGNRPEHVLLKLALNGLGVSMVPINPDLRPAELAYILGDCAPDLAIVAGEYAGPFGEAMALSRGKTRVAAFEEIGAGLPAAPTPPPRAGGPGPGSEASLLYTSGTTGQPKGCILSHEYELEIGAWYAETPGLDFREGGERWEDVRSTEATIVHYLGVVVAVLMAAPPDLRDRDHKVRFGAGAGVEPSLHRAFEERFSFPLIELWGMTEMCRVIIDSEESRSIDTRAFGRPRKGIEARVVDADDRDVPPGAPGEMLLRHSAETPRKGAFSGYLNKPEATEEAWRGGWLHTGDTVTMDETGLLTFVDRKKNIIRRSGENIAAAEVEACIIGDPRVAQVAVLAVPDPVREEEVMACVVTKPGVAADEALAEEIFARCMDRLAYFKAPGWVLFVDALPVTGTQKVVKHQIFAEGEDPTARPGAFDFRAEKRRK
jgi:crotonobetaine/carnitine-CoA ligase